MLNSAGIEIYPANKFMLKCQQLSEIIAILTFISRINDWLWRFKTEISIDFGYFSIYELLRFHAQLS